MRYCGFSYPLFNSSNDLRPLVQWCTMMTRQLLILLFLLGSLRCTKHLIIKRPNKTATVVTTVNVFHFLIPPLQSYGKNPSSHQVFLSKVRKAPVKGRKLLRVSSWYSLSPLFAITPGGSNLIMCLDHSRVG